MSGKSKDVMVDAGRLNGAVRQLCSALGSNAREAGLVADHLVRANLMGHDSHGIGMLPLYVGAAVAGKLRINHKARIALNHGPVVTIDGGFGFGQVIAFEAMEIGIERARQFGVAIVALNNSHHIGRIGHWGEQVARAGFISTHYVNVVNRPAVVAPFGGANARFGTNPYCCAIPVAGGEPLVLDMATSMIAVGKVRVANNKGVKVQAGALIDSDGNPTDDPGVIYRDPVGAVRTFGEHKGFGLAVVCEILAGALTGGVATHESTQSKDVVTNNMFSVIVDPAKLGGAATWADEMKASIRWIKASKPAPGVEQVLVPGEPERAKLRDREAKGIPVDAVSWREVCDASVQAGMAPGAFSQMSGVA